MQSELRPTVRFSNNVQVHTSSNPPKIDMVTLDAYSILYSHMSKLQIRNRDIMICIPYVGIRLWLKGFCFFDMPVTESKRKTALKIK